MQSRQKSDDLRDGLAAVEALARGKAPNAASIEAAVSALAILVERYDADGAHDKKAESSAMLATALRIGAGLADEGNRRAAFLRAREGALKARGDGVDAATKGGVNDLNLAAYVRATNEAALSALAAGEADASTEGGTLLDEAADHFAEAAAGYRRLGRESDAHLAEVNALEARSKGALRKL